VIPGSVKNQETLIAGMVKTSGARFKDISLIFKQPLPAC